MVPPVLLYNAVIISITTRPASPLSHQGETDAGSPSPPASIMYPYRNIADRPVHFIAASERLLNSVRQCAHALYSASVHMHRAAGPYKPKIL